MTYSEAVECKKNNERLVGTSERGFVVGKIIIVPSDSSDQDKFLTSYLRSYDDETAIVPFMNSSVEVWAIDTEHLYQNGILFHKKLQ